MSTETEPTAPLDLVIAGASILQECQRDKEQPSTAKQQALTELMADLWVGVKPDATMMQVLREGRHTPAPEPWTKALTEQVQPQRGLRTRRASWAQEKKERCAAVYREVPLMEGFHLPDNLEEAEQYVDRLVASGTDEYRVWLNCQHWFATRGQ